jgi:hypothetical protein
MQHEGIEMNSDVIFNVDDFMITVLVIFCTLNKFCTYSPIFVANLGMFLPLLANEMGGHTSAQPPHPYRNLCMSYVIEKTDLLSLRKSGIHRGIGCAE